ncbi:MAG: hypothetical protein WEF53_09930 [Bacteroidota bacterium]
MNEPVEVFPRDLTATERGLLMWVLPDERWGYRAIRSLVKEWKVTSRGRRGSGNYILSALDERVDGESPLPQVFAYGVVETDQGGISVTIREPLGNQVEFEIATLGRGDVVVPFHEIRRWTFSTWNPGEPCPICSRAVREVVMATASGRRMVLAICAADKRLWVCDERTQVNHPVPITNFYNELMFRQHIRDPEIALHPDRLFSALNKYEDAALIGAFRSYNMIRTKVPLEEEIIVPAAKRKEMLDRVRAFFGSSTE